MVTPGAAIKAAAAISDCVVSGTGGEHAAVANAKRISTY
jgi:hypothetical protein